jgi:TRAP-type C4-dicarboxylate transport system substrate-binding protein
LTIGLVAAQVQPWAQEVTLKVHHFLPPPSVAHAKFMQPWADKVEQDSGGRIKIEIYPAMQLGGKPPQLFDQVRDGVADVIWTVAGYTAGRFPTIEVFELPFVPGSAEATSQAAQEFYETYAREEFADVHPLMVHVHAPGLFHMKDKPITALEDLEDAKVRAPTRVINGALKVLGATNSHTEIGGPRGLYTAVFLFAMNKARYDSLPDDLKAVIDANSGLALAKRIGAVWDAAEAPGRAKAEDLGDAFHAIEGAELERWKKATKPVVDGWVAAMNAAGKDGPALLGAARALVAKYSGE